MKKERHQNIIEIREIIKSFENIGKIHLGGIPMIADDMMTFIKSDIIVYGLGVYLFIVFAESDLLINNALSQLDVIFI